MLLLTAAPADAAADNYLLAAACWLLPIMKHIIFAVVTVAAVVAVVAVVALVAVVAVVTVFAVVAPKKNHSNNGISTMLLRQCTAGLRNVSYCVLSTFPYNAGTCAHPTSFVTF